MNSFYSRLFYILLAFLIVTSSESFAAPRKVCNFQVDGAGFLPLLLPSGKVVYARSGAIKVDSIGRLRTHRYVLIPIISVPSDSGKVLISKTGKITTSVPDVSSKVVLGSFSLAKFRKPLNLIRIEKGLYRESVSSGPPVLGLPGVDGYGKVICR